MGTSPLRVLLARAARAYQELAARLDGRTTERPFPNPSGAVELSPYRRAATSSLSLAAPIPVTVQSAHKIGPSSARAIIAPTKTETVAVATVTLARQQGAACPTFTSFTAEITRQGPKELPIIERLSGSIELTSGGQVFIRNGPAKVFATGMVVSREKDRGIYALVISYRLCEAIGEGTLFAGFRDGQLVYLSGSGTGTDKQGHTVVMDWATVSVPPQSDPKKGATRVLRIKKPRAPARAAK